MLALRILNQTDGDVPQAIRQLAMIVLGRQLSETETEILLASQNHYAEHYQANPAAAEALIGMGEAKITSEIEPAQIAAWTMVCSQVMNLDEALTK